MRVEVDGPRTVEEAEPLSFLKIPVGWLCKGKDYQVEDFRQLELSEKKGRKSRKPIYTGKMIHSLCKVDGTWYKLYGSLNDDVSGFIHQAWNGEIAFPRKLTFFGRREGEWVRYGVLDRN